MTNTGLLFKFEYKSDISFSPLNCKWVRSVEQLSRETLSSELAVHSANGQFCQLTDYYFIRISVTQSIFYWRLFLYLNATFIENTYAIFVMDFLAESKQTII